VKLQSIRAHAYLSTIAIGVGAAVALLADCGMQYEPLTAPPKASGSSSTGSAGSGTTTGGGSGTTTGGSGTTAGRGSTGTLTAASGDGSRSGTNPSSGAMASSGTDASSGTASTGSPSSGSATSGSASAGASSGSGTGPMTVACPGGQKVLWALNLADPNWQSGLNFTFGNGKLKGWNGGTDNNVSVVPDPDKGQALKVFYGAKSGPNSCFTCQAVGSTAPSCTCKTSGGAEFYADFSGGKVLESAFLSYWVKLGDATTSFKFGKAGKLPGLSGGIPVSGLNTTDGSGFTGRLMWRSGICSGKSAELYWYGLPAGSSNVDDCGAGPAWDWQTDAKWHHVMMQLKMNTGSNTDGSVQLWYDQPTTATPDMDVQQLGMVDRTKFPAKSVNQFMFSTFFGGHDNTWGPSTDVYAYFADMQVCN
jgi:Polysaccharide lyase 14